MILHEIFRVVSRFPRYISCYIAENRFPLRQCSVLYTAWMGLRRHTFFREYLREYEKFLKTGFSSSHVHGPVRVFGPKKGRKACGTVPLVCAKSNLIRLPLLFSMVYPFGPI